MSQGQEQFVTLDFFKLMIQSTDNQDDDLYEQYVTNANKKVDTTISRYIETPIGEGSIYWDKCRDASLAYARSKHAMDIELIEKSDAYLRVYNNEMYGEKGTEGKPMAGGLIQELIAARTSKTQVALAVYDPRNIKVVLPGQLDLASTERFP